MAFKAHCPISIPHTPVFLALAMFSSPPRRPKGAAVPPTWNGQNVGVADWIGVCNVAIQLTWGKGTCQQAGPGRYVGWISNPSGKADGLEIRPTFRQQVGGTCTGNGKTDYG